jgi:uncharacterized protein (DUF1786 family)
MDQYWQLIQEPEDCSNKGFQAVRIVQSVKQHLWLPRTSERTYRFKCDFRVYLDGYDINSVNKHLIDDQIQNPRYCERNKDLKIGMAWTRG